MRTLNTAKPDDDLIHDILQAFYGAEQLFDDPLALQESQRILSSDDDTADAMTRPAHSGEEASHAHL